MQDFLLVKIRRSRCHSFAAGAFGLIGFAGWSFGQTPELVGTADAVVGKSDFTSNTPVSATATTTNLVTSVAIHPTTGQFFVADSFNNRILRWSSQQAAVSGQPADGAIGQSSLLDAFVNPGGRSATTLFRPEGMVFDSSGRLWVADSLNHRVMRFPAVSTDAIGTFWRTADKVLGQVDFSSGTAFTAAGRMDTPVGLWLDTTGSLWVADSGNNRVLRFNGVSAQPNGAGASLVLGQVTFTSAVTAAGARGMNLPSGVTVDNGSNLWVADRGNNRVLRFAFASAIWTNGIDASGVLGQNDFLSTDGGISGPSFDRFDEPMGVTTYRSNRLIVSDSANNRVLIYQNPSTVSSGGFAMEVLGQPDFTTNAPGLSAAGLSGPRTTTVTPDGAVWVADFNNARALRFNVAMPPPAIQIDLRGNANRTVGPNRNRIRLRGRATPGFAIARVEARRPGRGFQTVSRRARFAFPVALTAPRNVVRIRAIGTQNQRSPVQRVVIRQR